MLTLNRYSLIEKSQWSGAFTVQSKDVASIDYISKKTGQLRIVPTFSAFINSNKGYFMSVLAIVHHGIHSERFHKRLVVLFSECKTS